MLRRSLPVLTMTLAAVALATPAWARPGGSASSSPTGIDVSYPQCSDTLPSGKAFAVIGVTGGLANDGNACLGAEWAYAQGSTGTTRQAKAQGYLNTADPGNGVADWPSPGQPGAAGGVTDPDGTCGYASGTSGPGAQSTGCAWAYGYDMVAGITYSGGQVVGDLSYFASQTGGALYAQPVWLDVETGNSWLSGSSGLAMNIAVLQGMVAAVRDAATAAGVTAAPIGVYSTSSQWKQITGTPTGTAAGSLAGLPDWIPGAREQSGAVSNCGLASFTGGKVTITQWFGHPYDGDYSCIG